MMRMWMSLVAMIGFLFPVVTHGAKVVLAGPAINATGFYRIGNRWRSDVSSSTNYLALTYSYNGTNIILSGATGFESFTEGGIKKYTKRVYTLNEVNLVAVKGTRVGFSAHLEDDENGGFNVDQWVLSGPLNQGVISSLDGVATFLSWDRPSGNLREMYDVRHNLKKISGLQTAANVESRLKSQGYVYQETFLTDGLVASFPFNGDADDFSGNGNDGVNYGALLTFDRFGYANRAYYFNGINAYIQVNDAPSLRPTNALSISAWVRIDDVSTDYTRIVTKGKNLAAAYSNYQLITGTRSGFADYSEQPLFTLWPSERYDFPHPTHTLGYGIWHHMCGTWDGTTATLYYNGIKEGSLSIGGTMVYDSNPLVIGKDLFYNYCFNGAIDDIRIYNRALSSNEVQRLYNMTY